MEKIYSDYSQVLSEVYQIIEYMEPALRERIPERLINQIAEKRDKDYMFKYDTSKSLLDQDMYDESKHLISAIYINYVCDDNEKREILNIWSENDKKYEEELRKKYDVNNLFSSKTSSESEEKIEEYGENITKLIEQKEKGFFSKIWDKIKALFGNK